jgi:hypothetical protein
MKQRGVEREIGFGRLAAMAAIGIALAGPTQVLAHEDPPGCNETGASINVAIFRDANATIPLTGSVSPCEIVYYRGLLTKALPQQPGDTVCAFSGGQFDFRTPNGNLTVASANVPCIGATVGSVPENCVAGLNAIVTPIIQYTVNPADVNNGLISALSTYGLAGGVSGVAHDGVLNTPGVAQATPKQTAVLSCDDGNACTTDVCDMPLEHGAAGCSHNPVVCNDGNACTADGCDPATGCFHTDISAQCDDQNACTTDTCNPETGCVHTPIVCNDGSACTADSCDPATGCVHTAIVCNDGNACTADSCAPATGCVHTDTSANCNDSNACTTDTCNPATGCVHTPIVCNDNSACTADSCVPATGCVHTNTAPQCNDNNACTQDGCDPATGCTHTDISSQCNDNSACTNDSCVPATGCVHTPVVCNDGNACTADTCNPETGCVHTDTTAQCNDSNACTTDACIPATGCSHTTIVCQDNNACTQDSCVPATGCVHTDISQNCNDNNACTDDSCNPETGCVHTPSTNPECNELNHFQCYEIKPFAFGRRSASVVDRFGSATVSIRTPNRLCAPSDKRGEDPTAPQDPGHLMGYPDIAGPFRMENQTIENQFGRVTVNLIRRAFLFVPALKSLQSSPPAPVNPATDHFQCYLVKRASGTPRFTTIPGVTAVDQFGSHAMDLLRPRYFCTPANKNNEDPTAPTHAPQLLCYKARHRVRFGDKQVFTNDQFGPQHETIIRRMEFCVPSTFASPSGAFLD